MSLFKQFQTDKSAETDGIDADYGIDERTGERILIRVARAGGANSKFAKLWDAKSKPYRRQIQTETLDNATAERLMHEVYAEAVVIGWSGVCDRDGNKLDYNVENCVKLFKELPELFNDIRSLSTNISAFRAQELEEDGKN